MVLDNETREFLSSQTLAIKSFVNENIKQVNKRIDTPSRQNKLMENHAELLSRSNEKYDNIDKRFNLLDDQFSCWISKVVRPSSDMIFLS